MGATLTTLNDRLHMLTAGWGEVKAILGFIMIPWEELFEGIMRDTN